MDIFRVPATAVDSITALGEADAQPRTGFVTVNMGKVIYYRDLDIGGLVRLEDGIEMWLDSEWYPRFVNHCEAEARVNLD